MSFKFIIKFPIIILFIFNLSCQDRLSISAEAEKNKNIDLKKTNINNSKKIDLSYYENLENNIIDYYTNEFVNYNFLDKKLKKIKINNNLSLNIIHSEQDIYSINYKGDILRFNSETGKLIEKYKINHPIKNKIPVSFSLINKDFIIGFKSGEVISTNNTGEIIWVYENHNLLNTPIKYYNNNLIILFSDTVVFLSPKDGEVIYEKKYQSNNIIQSSGGKIVNYYNLIYFLLPNSEFHAIDTFLYEEHLSKLENIQINNTLNNLNDNLHVYKNYLVYLDNGNTIYTYNLAKNEFSLKNKRINNINSSLLFNNIFITKNEKYLEFHDIVNGDLLFNINIKKILKKNSKIIKIMKLNNKLHIFLDNGNILILNDEFKIENKIDLKINKINKIYNYKNKFFVSTTKGTTYIF